MSTPGDTREDLLLQIEELRARAEEAEAVIEAVRAGEVDAFVVGGPGGDQVFTLHGADEPYRLAIEQMNAGTATLTRDGVVLYCNNRLASMVGRTPEQLLGKAFASWVAPEEGSVWRDLLSTARSGPCDGELVALDGGRVPLRLWLSPMPDRTAAAVCLVVEDLTETRRREERLLRLAAMRDAAERVGLVGSWTADPAAGTMTWSPGVYALLDIDAPPEPSERVLTVGGDLDELLRPRVHPDDLPVVQGIAASPVRADGRVAVDFRVRRRDGSVRHLHAEGSVEPQDAGTPGRLVGVLQDVTERVVTERQLQLDESRLRALVEGIPDIVFQLDLEHRLVSGNERFHALIGGILGRRLEEGESVERVEVPDKVRATWRDGHARALAGCAFTEEIAEEIGGRALIWETSFTPVMVDGEAVGVVYAARDVTEQRRSEAALRESEAMRDLAEAMGRTMSWTLDLRTGAMTWSRGVRAIYDLDDDDIGNELAGPLQQGVLEASSAHILPDDRERVREHSALMLATRTYEPIDFRIRHRDGSIHWVHAGGRIYLGEDGAPARIVGYNVDVTERVEAMEEIRHSEAMRDAAERVGRLASWTTDLSTGVTSWSAGVYALYDPERPVAEPEPADLMSAVLSRVARDDRELMVARMQDAAALGQAAAVDYRVRHRDGSEHIVSGTAEVERDGSGEPVRIVGYQQDVTEQRLAEAEIRALNADLERRVEQRTAELMERTAQLEESSARLAAANRELEAFSYSVSHDLRAPLRAVDGFSALVAESAAGRLSADEQADLQRVRTGAQHMSSLIDDLLDLSRIGRREVELGEVDLSDAATLILAELAAAEPGRRVEARIQPGLRARADQGLVVVLLTNLLGNAWKFTARKEEAHIEVGARAEEGEPVFFVRDDGAGFDQTQAGRLFAPFRRLHSADEFSGTGIGLATVQRIVARHGGRCWAEGEVGAGATFFFTLAAPDGGGAEA